jgi:2-succinyl-5-enolpyruvyl-6-hydroxy-3-cyclohexene-1-carboxylate synthase
VARQVSVNAQATFCATLVDEWVQLGVTDAVICPGSRSTPLAIALADRLDVHVRLDERSAAFFALGLAMAHERPAVVCTTSGTAAVELHPAVVEAHHAGIPLIVCTADRPPELQGIGASQTIDQVGLFTTSTRWFSDPGVPDEEQAVRWRPLAVRAFEEAMHGPQGPGPVHLNLAFREPLIGEPGPLPGRLAATKARFTGNTKPRLLTGRGLIVAGANATRDPSALVALSRAVGWPLLADPLSGCRLEGTIAAADAIVRCDVPRPDHVLLLGTPWLSKALAGYLTTATAEGAAVTSLDPWRTGTDPNRIVTEFLHVDPNDFIAHALHQAATRTPADTQWFAAWAAYEQTAQAAINETLAGQLNEPQLARCLATFAAEHGSSIVVSASMPIRDLEWFAPALPNPPRVLANRGTNGIDGVTSTALGVAAATGRPTIALLGDLAFLHDVSGLVNLPNVPCTFVVPDNSGGGIFSFLPQADALQPATFEHLFGTPPTTDIGAVARAFGLSVHDVGDLAELDAALKDSHAATATPVLIRAQVPGRSDNVALHDAVNQAVRLALR